MEPIVMFQPSTATLDDHVYEEIPKEILPTLVYKVPIEPKFSLTHFLQNFWKIILRQVVFMEENLLAMYKKEYKIF